LVADPHNSNPFTPLQHSLSFNPSLNTWGLMETGEGVNVGEARLEEKEKAMYANKQMNSMVMKISKIDRRGLRAINYSIKLGALLRTSLFSDIGDVAATISKRR
jgi:hypothetical protein